METIQQTESNVPSSSTRKRIPGQIISVQDLDKRLEKITSKKESNPFQDFLNLSKLENITDEKIKETFRALRDNNHNYKTIKLPINLNISADAANICYELLNNKKSFYLTDIDQLYIGGKSAKDTEIGEKIININETNIGNLIESSGSVRRQSTIAESNADLRVESRGCCNIM